MENQKQLLKEERKRLEMEERQRQNEESRRQAIKQKQFKNLKKWIFVIVGAGILILIISFFVSKSGPSGEDFSQKIPFEGDEHLAEGTPVEYESNPPTSGNHWPEALADGIYDLEKPDQAVVHSMEHGRVWISYNPSIPEETVRELENFLKGKGAVILTPREANETDIALAGWMRLDTFNLPNGKFTEEYQKRILDFINRYRHKGPEFIPGIGPGKTYE